MYPFLNHMLPDDFPPAVLSFINWVILAHCLALAFYLVGLAKDIFVGVPPKVVAKKQQ